MTYSDEDSFREEDSDSSIEFEQNAGFWNRTVGHLLVGTGGSIFILCVLLVPSLWNLVFIEEQLPTLAIRIIGTLAITGLAWIAAGLFCWKRHYWIAMIAFAIGYIILSLGLPDR